MGDKTFDRIQITTSNKIKKRLKEIPINHHILSKVTNRLTLIVAQDPLDKIVCTYIHAKADYASLEVTRGQTRQEGGCNVTTES